MDRASVDNDLNIAGIHGKDITGTSHWGKV